mmetsp:Transcript_28733/g.82544  ORF Transcript_28733/g.82544 Transcript_28733/m.82544 type:complete len:255 (+) Transcript_28733:316-1080(+)
MPRLCHVPPSCAPHFQSPPRCTATPMIGMVSAPGGIALAFSCQAAVSSAALSALTARRRRPECIRERREGVVVVSTSRLHTGQDLLMRSHWSTQVQWYSCPHGSSRNVSPAWKACWQTTHCPRSPRHTCSEVRSAIAAASSPSAPSAVSLLAMGLSVATSAGLPPPRRLKESGRLHPDSQTPRRTRAIPASSVVAKVGDGQTARGGSAATLAAAASERPRSSRAAAGAMSRWRLRDLDGAALCAATETSRGRLL